MNKIGISKLEFMMFYVFFTLALIFLMASGAPQIISRNKTHLVQAAKDYKRSNMCMNISGMDALIDVVKCGVDTGSLFWKMTWAEPTKFGWLLPLFLSYFFGIVYIIASLIRGGA